MKVGVGLTRHTSTGIFAAGSLQADAGGSGPDFALGQTTSHAPRHRRCTLLGRSSSSDLIPQTDKLCDIILFHKLKEESDEEIDLYASNICARRLGFGIRRACPELLSATRLFYWRDG
ncbi:hypothetical protein FHR70_000192 [Microvirga lupini]|uniref:Uncharacterized protein n=1 Tax=Microvirga lupini TaxID=420324 RepID=A0A7W4YU74_9HYPH|nr:hypothetical protein [Microvirga lupini]MBB3017152.1 hypothetical protein [Microvirga lupini]